MNWLTSDFQKEKEKIEGKNHGGVLNFDYRRQLIQDTYIGYKFCQIGKNEKTRRTEGYHKLSVNCYRKENRKDRLFY